MSRKDENNGLFALATLILVLPSAAWSGFVLVRLWTWFVAPLGVPQIEVWQAAGLALTVRWLSDDSKSDSSDSDRSAGERFGKAIGLMILTPLFMLIFGAIYHAFMS